MGDAPALPPGVVLPEHFDPPAVAVAKLEAQGEPDRAAIVRECAALTDVVNANVKAALGATAPRAKLISLQIAREACARLQGLVAMNSWTRLRNVEALHRDLERLEARFRAAGYYAPAGPLPPRIGARRQLLMGAGGFK